MKKYQMVWVVGSLLLAVLAIAGCTATPAGVQEAVESLAPVIESTAVSHETSAEPHESSSDHEVACDPADIPAPSAAGVVVRFVNASGGEMIVEWRDTSSSPPRLVEYARLANGDSHDQETFEGHEWVMTEVRPDDKIYTLEYAASAETQQCVTFHHWSYEGEGGPEHWADLREEFDQCGLGRHQSPIHLTGSNTADLENIGFSYGQTPVKILNNGHTIQVDKITNNHITIAGEPYQLVQFHFHTPSEHIVDGVEYPLEMHLVHENADKELAVVGVLIDRGENNSAFDPVWDHLPENVAPAVDTGEEVNVSDLIPSDRIFYLYSGSLTTPPCDENVTWVVLSNPVKMSGEQIDAITDILGDTNRPPHEVDEHNPRLDQTP